MKARIAFLDTGALYAFVNRNDTDHGKVVAAYRATDRFLAHSAILMETFSLVAKRLSKPLAIRLVEGVLADPKVEVVHLTEALKAAAWTRCVRFSDKEWDWIDCASFELMEQRGVRHALTLDHHFRQAGFIPLVKPGG